MAFSFVESARDPTMKQIDEFRYTTMTGGVAAHSSIRHSSMRW
jgi:hypothetical protein